MKGIEMNVWKVASRWSEDGHANSSILDIFRTHNVVFVGKYQERFGYISSGELIAISDGKKVVAMGIAMDDPTPVTEIGIEFSEEEKRRFGFEKSTLACRVSFTDLPKEKHLPYRIGTVHRVQDRAQEFRNVFNEIRDGLEGQEFEIDARSCTLLKNTRSKEDVLWKENLFFRVPVYQRPYSWKEDQVRQLVQDLLSSFRGLNGKVRREPMFIGTMQLSDKKLHDNQSVYFHEVIDGQQRISTLILLLKVLRDRFPEHPLLCKIFSKTRLQTRVSGGIQQQYLQETLELNTKTTFDPRQNPYLNVLPCIVELLEEEPEEEGVKTLEDELDEFISYLTSQVYFVVIETRATLSKTLQIFDAINTAGMDLSGGDVFKVRYYEYLKNRSGGNDLDFEKISALYEAVDKGNASGHICSIENILSLMQHVLIVRNEMPKHLHVLASTTFFDRFFDTVSNVNKWGGFDRDRCNKIDMKIADFESLIFHRFEFEKISQSFGSEARCALNFLRSWFLGGYNRYQYLPILFGWKFNAEQAQLERFVVEVTKLFTCYGIVWHKITAGRRNPAYELLQKIVVSSESVEEVFAEIHNRRVGRKAELTEILTERSIAHLGREKNLICRTSAMLDELGLDEKSQKSPEALVKLLFDTKIDIEHIESANHKDGSKREKIWDEWKKELHQVGNLMVLEMTKNRSISNEGYVGTKLPVYEGSDFSIVQRQAREFKTWDLESCKQRKHTEVDRLVRHLCG